ncbi:MAG: RAQPRD family integrative conjugative element protein [Pedobacter sp.]
MKTKNALLISLLFGSVALTGCATNGTKDSSVSEQAMPVPVEEVATSETEIIAYPAIEANSVSVKPSYYNYETSDMSSSERKALLDILSHLQEADVLIRTAESQQNPDQRIKFRYDWLRKDIYKINRGISDYLSSPESQPRSFEPVMGDYRR